MAGVSDCFSIGSTVACTTCFKQNIEGEVLAFDPSTKMLVLSILLQNTIKKKSSHTNKLGFGNCAKIHLFWRAGSRQSNGWQNGHPNGVDVKECVFSIDTVRVDPPNVYSHKLVTFSEMADYPYRMPSNRLS